MSSLEKRQTGRGGSMQCHRKYSDGFSDTSSSGSFMDETDKEVSNLTDRAFRSLCIEEEAIYNDSEFSSSPTKQHKDLEEETQQRSSQETISSNVQQYGKPEKTSTFQHSYMDVTHQEQAFRDGSLSYVNNCSEEVTWQQGRSASRVSSLIKAFSSGECYQDGGTGDVILAKDKYRAFENETWDKSALLSIQRELSEFSAGYHQNFKSGPFQSYRNHFYSSNVATNVAQMDTMVLMKSSKSKLKAMDSKNFFFHSEFSPFQLWEEYNRFPFERTEVSGFMSPGEFPRWYDSPMYKELEEPHKIPNSPSESRSFNQRQIQDVVPGQCSRSTVIQKASAIEKRCESEMASNCPPLKKNNSFVRNKFPSNRPSTVSPTNAKTFRPDSSFFSYCKVTQNVQHKVADSTLPSSVTPFNITQLLTPIITRQETETSEILQFAHTPSVSDFSSQGETDPKPLTDAKHLRDSYKSRASSLLFNLKDNRKRVKSTYSPTGFKGLQITDLNKQTSNLEGRESRFSDILVSMETQENFVRTDTRVSSNQIQEPSVAPFTFKDCTDAIGSYDNLTLISPQIQNWAFNYKSFCGSSDSHPNNTDLPAYTESIKYEPSSHNISSQDKSSVTSEGQCKDLNSTFCPTSQPEIASMLPKTHPPKHSMATQTAEQQRHGLSNNASPNYLQTRKDFGRKTQFEYSQNEFAKERYPLDHTGSVNSTGKEMLTNDGRSEAQLFREEIAALIEMDKERKATAKQYLPTVNDGYSVRKETYMQKVNDDIKLGRLAKDEEKDVREETASRKQFHRDKPLYDNQLSTSAKSIDTYGFAKNNHQKKTSSPPKGVNVYGGLQNCPVKNDLTKEILLSERGPEQLDQRALNAPVYENKGQKNEVLFPYQPYIYEPNKQWHMSSTSEDQYSKDSEWTQRQSNNSKIANTLSNSQPSALNKTMVNQNELSTKGGTPTADSIKPTIDNFDQNNPGSQTKREDRFSINDILTIRDYEQAKRIKENTYSSDLAKSVNPQNQIKHEIAEIKPSIKETVKEQEPTARGYKIQKSASPAPRCLKRDFHNANEGLANINKDRNDRLKSKDNDKVTTKQLSYKERGQSKQEMLTSKLKVLAKNEILAIKEKGQSILARNNEKAQDGQEVHHSKRKEITAEKLNHLFQDITYSSVTQYKEEMKTQNDHPKYGSPPSRKKLPMDTLNSQEDNQTAVSKNYCKYVKPDKALAIERQKESVKSHVEHPANNKEITKAPLVHIQSAQDGGGDEKNQCKHDVQKNTKNFLPAKILKDEQISRASVEDLNPKEELANQSLYVHEMSPSEMISGSHLTSIVNTENYTSHKPPALCVENQKDQKEKMIPKYHPFENAGESSLTLYTYSEQALTKPTDVDAIKTDDRPSLTNTENLKANTGLNENSQKSTDVQDRISGLGPNTKRAEEANVHHKSGITTVPEQSKNQLIKNSSRISASQLTSLLSDMKLKTGIPPAKLLTDSAKLELTSKLKANTMEDAEQFKNGIYKHNYGVNSGVTPVSSTKNIVKHNTATINYQFFQKTKEKDTPKCLIDEDGEELISKNNTRMENYFDLPQQNNPSVAVETTPANKILGNQSESGTNKELMCMGSEKGSFQQKEHLENDESTKDLLSVGKNEHLQNKSNDESEAINNNQWLEEESTEQRFLGSACPKHGQAQKGGGFPGSSKNYSKSTKEPQELASENPGSPSKTKKAVEDPTEANASTSVFHFSQNTVMGQEGTTQSNNIHLVSTHTVDSTRDVSSDAILIPSKEQPTEEPSICMTSKTEAASDDEPMIYNICVSSKCHIDEPQNPDNHEEKSSDETELSAVRCLLRSEEEESVPVKMDKDASIAQRETEVSSKNKVEKEYTIRKPEPLATTDKQDCYKTSNVGSISSSYEDLLAKYGLRYNGYAKSKQHMQDKRERNEKEESETHLSQKLMKHEINRSLASNEKSSETQVFPKDLRENLDQQASLRTTPLIKESTGKTKQQDKQHYDNPLITSNYKAEMQQRIGNDGENISNRDATPIPKDTTNAEKQDQDSKNTEELNKRNCDIQSKDKKAEEQVRNTEKVQRLRKKEDNADNVSNSKTFPMEIENVSLTAKQHAATGDLTSTAETAEAYVGTTKDYKPNETTSTEKNVSLDNEKPRRVVTEDKILNRASDMLLTQHTKEHISKTLKSKDQKIDCGGKQENCTELEKESISAKVDQALQNSIKGNFGEKKAQSEQGKVNTSNKITDRMKLVSKDGAATHVNNYLDKFSSIDEDVRTVVKQDQISFEVPKIHFEDIKVSTKKLSSSKEFMADHKIQHEVIKRESLREKKGVPEVQNNMKGTIEMTPKQIANGGKEVAPPPKKDSPVKASSLINTGENSISELGNTAVNLREGAVWTQKIQATDSKRTALNHDKGKNKDSEVSSPSGQLDDGDLKVDKNRSSLRGNKQINGEAMEMQPAYQTNTNQYQTGEGLVPETKRKASEQGYAEFSATQRGKNVTRPKLSAIADYARLKVISTEEDEMKEIDLLPEIVLYNSHDLSVLGIPKHLHRNVAFLDTAGESEISSNEKEKGQIHKQRPLQFQERGKESFLTQKQNHSNPGMSTQPKPLSLVASSSEDGEFVFEGLESTQERAFINHKESNTNPAFMEQIIRGGYHKIYQSKNTQGINISQSQAEGKTDLSRSTQLSSDNTIDKDSLSVSQNLPFKGVSGTVKTVDNPINMISPAGEEMDELQYYTVNAFDRDTKQTESPKPSPLSHKMTQNNNLAEKLEEEKKEDSSFLQSLIGYGKVQVSGPQSNSSSPAMGKPVMFKVKDNTIRTTSVTKTVKPCFHKPFSDDFRIGSPKEHLSGSEKGDEEHVQHKESANPPILHDPAIASNRLHKVRETLQNNLPSVEYTEKQSKGLQRRSQILEEEETRSVISTMSEDIENCTASFVDMSDMSAAYMPKNERYRDTYKRPASACYERAESACYERPESACSDMRPLGKPPAVPPKSEKALRRAQRLTTRRMKKAETQTSENQEQQTSKSIQNVSSVPSSPSDIQSTPLAVEATPHLSQYGIVPNYTTPVHSMVGHHFPLTQRKLLQDTTSGQYFMVDVPLPVKTKTLYDLETGKYVQLNVGQRSQGALMQPASVEMLNTPYMLHPGFVPLAASLLPALKSSSQMSAPATLTEEQDGFKAGSEPWRQNVS